MPVNINVHGSLAYFTFPLFEKYSFIRHCFSSRQGGVSNGFFSTMNMSFTRGDKRSNVEKNYKTLCKEIGIDFLNLVLTHQTHTSNVIDVNSSHKGTGFYRPAFCDVDGLITNEYNVALVSQYADCTPLFFCDIKNRVIATAHSGWRGTAAEIGRVTIEKMCNDYNSKPENIIAAIGPCIGQCCYEVDDPVFDAISKLEIDVNAVFNRTDEGKYMFDLSRCNRLILENCGIKPDNIEEARFCTACNTDLCFSHRAMGENRGNMAGIIQLTGR